MSRTDVSSNRAETAVIAFLSIPTPARNTICCAAMNERRTDSIPSFALGSLCVSVVLA
jgi:hypothetical protein